MINTKSFSARDLDEFTDYFSQAIKQIEFEPTLAFVFLSISIPIKSILEKFKSKNIRVLGSSSCGELLFDGHQETISENGIVVTLTDINPKYFKLGLFERNNLKSKELGEHVGAFINESFDKPSLIITASGLTLDGQKLVEGIVAIAGNDLIMYGGLAGDDSKFEKTVVFDEITILDSGAAALVFDSQKIEMNGFATSGWVGLGAELIVSKSESNIVYKIDDQPALDVYTEYLNVDINDLPAIGVEYPLMIKRDDNVEALRAVVGIDIENKALIFAGSVPQGSVVTFSSSPGFNVIDNTLTEVEGFYEKYPKGDMFILFSCMARHLALGPMISQEIALVTKKWKAPIIGFFTYGEIGTNNKKCDFYNQTYSLVKLTEI